MLEFNVRVTDAGLAAFADAAVNGTPITIYQMALGDGNGEPITPDQTMTALVHEVSRHPTLGVSVSPDNANWIRVDALVPGESGNYTIREVGLYDTSDTLIAIGAYPEQYKPTLAQGASEDLTIRMIMEVTNVAEITIVDAGSTIYLTKTDFQNSLFEVVTWYVKNW